MKCIAKRHTSYYNLSMVFDLMNKEFFENKLTDVIITVVRKNQSKGYYYEKSFIEGNKQIIPEIALNPDLFQFDEKIVLSTLLHEMCHHYQALYGTTSKNNYHNKEFSEIMKNVGLQTYDLKTNKSVGYAVTHNIIPDGKYDTFYNSLKEKGNIIDFKSYHQTLALNGGSPEDEEEIEKLKKKARQKKKIKYTCKCGCNVWGKPGLNIKCESCESEYIEEIQEEKKQVAADRLPQENE